MGMLAAGYLGHFVIEEYQSIKTTNLSQTILSSTPNRFNQRNLKTSPCWKMQSIYYWIPFLCLTYTLCVHSFWVSCTDSHFTWHRKEKLTPKRGVARDCCAPKCPNISRWWYTVEEILQLETEFRSPACLTLPQITKSMGIAHPFITWDAK